MLKSNRYLKGLLIILLVLVALNFAIGAGQTFTGVLSDSMCGAKHMVPGKTDADCTQICVKAKAKYALVAGDKVYVLAGSLDAAPSLAGKHVEITGEKSGNTITVNSIRSTDK